MEYVKCNICGTDDTYLVTSVESYNFVKCVNCGLVYLNPRYTSEHLESLYTDYHCRKGMNEDSWFILMRKNFDEIAHFLNAKFQNKGTILDVGCAYGHFVEIMQNYGWTATGIDPSPATIISAKKRKLDIFKTTLEKCSFPKDSFDAITMFYVLEHLHDPISALQKLFELLKPGGLIVLRIPHSTPIVNLIALLGIKNNIYHVPFHLYDFSPKVVRIILEKTGFSDIKIIPGSPTIPKKYMERLVSKFSGNLAKIIFALSMGKLLLPGVSKTVIAHKI